MNKKGQITGQLGIFIITAVAVIVGIVLFQVIAQNVGESTNTISVANESISTVVNGTDQYLTDYRAISDVVIYNETGDALITSGNYTITNNVLNPTTGALSVKITPDASADVKSAWQVSGTAQPLTYIADSGSRSAAGLIAIFFALAILAAAMYPIYGSRLMEMFGR